VKALSLKPALLLGLTVATCVYLAEIPLISLLLPELSGEFGVDGTQIRYISISYGVFVALAVLAAGWLGDRYGIRPIIVAGISAFFFGSIIVSLSDSFSALVFGRVLQGIGGGLFSPLVPVALVRLAPHRPGRSLAMWNFTIGLVTALSPLVAAPIVQQFGWRPVLMLLSFFALLSLLFIVVSSRYFSLKPTETQSSEVSNHNPRILSALMTYVGLHYGTALLFLFWAPLSIERMGVSPGISAWVLSVTWLFFGIAGILIRRGIDTNHVNFYLVFSPLVMLCGWLIFLFSGTNAISMVFAGAVIGFGLGLGNAPSTLVILKHASENRSSVAVSLDVSFSRLGSVGLIWLLGAIADAPTLAVSLCLVCLVNTACTLPLFSWRRIFNSPRSVR